MSNPEVQQQMNQMQSVMGNPGAHHELRPRPGRSPVGACRAGPTNYAADGTYRRSNQCNSAFVLHPQTSRRRWRSSG
jgi:hypothetical protein